MGDMADELQEAMECRDAKKRLLQTIRELGKNESTQEDMHRRLAAVKSAQVGTRVKCPTCKKRFTKKTYQHTFCSRKGRNNCKDRFHNIQPHRIERSRAYA